MLLKIYKVQFLIPILCFILLWQVVSTSGMINKTLFPAPTPVFTALFGLTFSGELFLHVKSSLWRALTGLALGSLAGVLVGLFTGRIPLADRSITPLIHVFRSFPPVALIPLIIVWFGIGDVAKIIAIGLAVFFPVWVNTHTGAARIPHHYLWATHTLTSSHYKKWAMVILPASLPFIIGGIRTGIAVAYVMVFVSELAGASQGIGYFIAISQLAYRMDRMMVGLFLLGLFGYLTDYAFVKVVRGGFPWLEKV